MLIDGGTEAETNTLVTVLEYGAALPVTEVSHTLEPVFIAPAEKVVSGDGSSPSFGIPTPMPMTPAWTLTADVPRSGRTLGRADAPVTVDVWSDFRCTFCAAFAAGPEQELINNYVRLGKVRIAYHDLIVVDQGDAAHDSLDAAAAARAAADQGKFWEYAGLLFANVQDGQEGVFRRDVLVALANSAGLDVSRFRTDLDGGTFAADVPGEIAHWYCDRSHRRPARSS